MPTTTTAAPADVAAARPRTRGWSERATRQRDLIVTYQAALAAAGGQRREVNRDGRDALEAVLADVEVLLRSTVHQQLSRRFPGIPPADMLEDALAEARLATIDAAGRYDVTSAKTFAGWLVDPYVGGPVITAVQALMGASSASGCNLSKGQAIAARYAYGVVADFHAHGIEPSSEQIRAKTYARCMEWARERACDQLGVEVDEHDPVLAERIEQIAISKLSRNGALAAMDDLDDLMAATATVDALDPETAEAAVWTRDSASPGHGLVTKVATVGVGEREQDTLWAALLDEGAAADRPVGLDGQTSASLRAGRAQVAARVADAAARLGAPHAQFAALSPTLNLQFEHAGALLTPRGLTATLRRLPPLS